MRVRRASGSVSRANFVTATGASIGSTWRRAVYARVVPCARNARRASRGTVWRADAYKDALRIMLEQPRARQKYRLRRTLGERVCAELTERQGLRRFHRRGLAGVTVEFALHCIAFDLKVALRHPAASRLVVGSFSAMLYQRVRGAWACVGVTCAVHTG